MSRLRLKWSEEQIRYFSKPIKTAERKIDWIGIIVYSAIALFLFGIVIKEIFKLL